MPIPSGLSTITVTSSYPAIDGAPQTGSVLFETGQRIIDATGKVIFSGTATRLVFHGVMQPIILPCTDNTSLNPTGYSYKITETLNGVTQTPYWVNLPSTLGATVDLSALAPTGEPPDVSAFASNNVWTGSNTFQGETIVPTPVNASDAATKAYVDRNTPSWITLPSNWYSGAWFTAKTNIASSPAWILFDGDSVTNGVNPANNGYLATGWPDQLRASVLASTGASVYGDFYPVWSYTLGSGALNPLNEGFASLLTGASTFEGGFGTCLSQGSSNQWMQIVTTGNVPGWTSGNVTGFDLVWYDWGSCTWGFTIDGGQGGTPTVNGATWNGSMWQVTGTGGAATAGNVKKVTIRGLTSGSHAIEYGQVSSAGNMMIIGVSLFTGNNNGIGFVRSAYSGRRAVDSATAAGTNMSFTGTFTAFPSDRPSLWSGSGPTNATAQITPTPFGFPTQPSLAFIGYGINDCATYVNTRAYGDAIERKIIAVRRGVPNANIGLIAFSYPDIHNSDNNLTGNGGRYSRYKRVMAELAASYNCALIDIDSKWGGNPVAQGFMQSGNVHPTQTGSADIAAVVASVI